MVNNDIRYKNLVVQEGEYVPDAGIDYPQDNPYARIVPSKQTKVLEFDSSYPFLDDSVGFKFKRCIAYALARGPFCLVNFLKYGVRYENRSVLRRYRKEFRNGIISLSNHCYMWDGMAVSQALRRRVWIPMLSDLLTSSNSWLLKHFGGIPLPDGSFGAVKKFNDAFDVHHSRKAWIHFFPEARSWHFYKPVRPFKKGAFTMAYKWDCPILPVALVYRERTGIHLLFAPKRIPLITVRLGEPIFPDPTKPRKEEVDRLLEESFKALCTLAGIKENSWPSQWSE